MERNVSKCVVPALIEQRTGSVRETGPPKASRITAPTTAFSNVVCLQWKRAAEIGKKGLPESNLLISKPNHVLPRHVLIPGAYPELL